LSTRPEESYRVSVCVWLRNPEREAKGPSWTISACEWMNLNETQLNYVFCVTAFIEGSFCIFVYFDFFLLSPCATEHCLAYRWWCVYHSLRNALLEYATVCHKDGYSRSNYGRSQSDNDAHSRNDSQWNGQRMKKQVAGKGKVITCGYQVQRFKIRGNPEWGNKPRKSSPVKPIVSPVIAERVTNIHCVECVHVFLCFEWWKYMWSCWHMSVHFRLAVKFFAAEIPSSNIKFSITILAVLL
jgi:hypothetical protein